MDLFTTIECPPVKIGKLETCPTCHKSPCQCGRTRIEKVRKPRTRKRTVRKCRSKKTKKKMPECEEKLKCTRSAPVCVEYTQCTHKCCECCTQRIHKCERCHQDKSEDLQLCTQELINFCWLLLEPETLNRIRVLLHDEHGYTFQEADDYIEQKQTNVLNDLRLMAISGKVTRLGCYVINFLMERRNECSCSMQKHVQEIFNCFASRQYSEVHHRGNPLKNKRNLFPSDDFRLQSILERLVGDIQHESKRITKCSARYDKCNTQNIIHNQCYTPWEAPVQEKKNKTKTLPCAPTCDPTNGVKKYEDWMQCMKKLLKKNYKTSDIKSCAECCDDKGNLCNLVRNLMNYNEENKQSTGRVSLKYPCRTIIRATSRSNYAIVTSCCEPQLQVVKDQSTDVSESILKVRNTQTISEPPKQMRSQYVQTELKGQHIAVQTESEKLKSVQKTFIPEPDEESEDMTSFMGGLLNNMNFITKKKQPDDQTKSLVQSKIHKPNEQIEAEEQSEISLSFLKNMMNNSMESAPVHQSSAEDYESIEDTSDLISDKYVQKILASRLAPKDNHEKLINDESIHKILASRLAPKDTKNDNLISDESIRKILASHLPEDIENVENEDKVDCSSSTCENSITSSQQYFEAREESRTSFFDNYVPTYDTSEYYEAKDKIENESPKTNKRVQYYEAKDNTDNANHSNNHKRSPYYEAKDDMETEPPRTYIFINKKPSMQDDAKSLSYHTAPQSVDHVKFNLDFNKEDLLGRIFDRSDDDNFVSANMSPQESLYTDALDKDDGKGNEEFQSTDMTACEPNTRGTNFYANKKLNMSEIPYKDKKQTSDKQVTDAMRTKS